MKASPNISPERLVAEEFLLRYYNDYLLSHGVITENEHRKMLVKITQHSASLKAKRTSRHE